jgi:superfamily II DNA or RNA helicase
MSHIPKMFPTDLIQHDSALLMKKSFDNDKILKYSDPIGNGNRCTSEYLRKKELSLAQTVVKTIAKSISNNKTSNKGLLVWHSTGSGKTLTSMAIIDSFWDSSVNIIFVSSIESLQSNPPSTFYENAEMHFDRFKNKNTDDITNMFKKRNVKFLSFAKLSHFLLISRPLKSVKTPEDIEFHKNYLSNSVLIIDEVQNIFHPLPNQKSEHNALKKFLLAEPNETSKNMKVFILTATPGDSLQDTINLLNIVRDVKSSVITIPNINNEVDMNRFQKQITGLISYFNSSKDLSRFPRLIEDNRYKLEFSKKHFEKYIEVFNKEKKNNTSFEELHKNDSINKYYKTLRKYSNMDYLFESDDPIKNFSSKIPKLLNIVQHNKADKHYIYSAFYENRGFGGQGIRAIANFLESQFGFIRITNPKDTKFMKKNTKGYVLVINNELKDTEHLKKLVNIFNDKDSNVNFFLASQSYNEGVDLKNVKHLHLFEPMLTQNAEKQAIGRAIRFCSHAALPFDEWKLQIHRYISTVPADLSKFNGDKMDIKYYRLKFKQQNIESELKDKYIDKTKKKTLMKENLLVQKDLQKVIKESNKLDDLQVEKVFSVDELIYQESLDRIYEQHIIFEVMKSKAIDCQLLSEFHKNGDEIIKCL